jgi:alpha-tubulin suppressor-like RCC1 family protein
VRVRLLGIAGLMLLAGCEYDLSDILIVDGDAATDDAGGRGDGGPDDADSGPGDCANPTTSYADRDQDGHGDDLTTREGCGLPSGFVATGNDCDDDDASRHPGASELCNAADDDCDDATDEAFADLGDACSVGTGACAMTGELVCSGDGTGTACSVAAGAPVAEICGNDLDEDCNDVADDGCGVTQVAMLFATTCARISDGTVRCWGDNSVGGLGIGVSDADVHGVPVKVPGLNQVTQLDVGDRNACAVRADHTLHCWGRNTIGELGTGDDQNKQTPTEVALTNVAHVAMAPTATCALRTSGAVFCWGESGGGLLATNEATYPPSACFDQVARDCHLTPLPVMGLGAGVDLIEGGGSSHFAVGDGTPYYFGIFILGESGMGSATCSYPCTNYPTPVTIPDPVIDISISSYNSACAITDAHEAYCVGSNSEGKLGINDANAADAVQFTKVYGGVMARQISVGGNHVCMVSTDDKLYCWGDNSKAQLGLGAAVPEAAAPMLVALPNGAAAQSVSCGYTGTCAVDTAGKLYCWGENDKGQLGMGVDDVTTRSTPTLVNIE